MRLAGKDAGMTDRGDVECPDGLLRTCGKIFKIGFDSFV